MNQKSSRIIVTVIGLQLMDAVARTGKAVVIAKHGRPVAQLARIPPSAKPLFRYMKDTLKILGDVLAPIDEEWHALSGKENQVAGRVRTKQNTRRGK